METFGERLRRLRAERGVSRYAVSKATGLSQPLLSRLDALQTGRHVQGHTLQQLARFFGLTMEELLGEEEEEDQHHAA
jgi:transcriptional regulator with XRE-family HTH domain